MTLFQDNKSWFSYLYVEILNLLEEMNYQINEVNSGANEILKDIVKNISNFRLANICDNLKINLLMIERRNMKCVMFGKTSNGKSAVINALLGKKVLPSSIGRTTSCFISIEGCKENEGYLEDIRGNRRELSEIDVLANEFDENCDKINSCLHVYWPRQKCRLLTNDLEILDSPGVDYTSENDEWIDRYCEDADEFVLVINGTSTLDQTERDFFLKVKEKIATPNVFVLINKWDTTENDPEDEKQQLRTQHVETVTEFLREDLNLYKECNIEDRMFFVSAREALNRNEKYSFNNFEECLMKEMTENAIKIKFKPHLDKAREVLFTVNDLINSTFSHVESNSKFDVSSEKIDRFESNINNIMSRHFTKTSSETERLIWNTISELETSVKNAVENNSDLSKATILSLEEYFPKNLSSIFSQNIRNLEKEIKEYFKEFFGLNVTNNQMKVYFNDKNDFKKAISKYEDEIMFNLANTSSSIRDLSKEKEASYSSKKDNVSFLKKTVQILTFPAIMLIGRFVPVLIPIIAGMDFAVQALPEPSNKEILELIFQEFKSFYKSLTNYFLDENKNLVREIVEIAMVLFIDHLREIKATENEFIEKRIKCLELIEKTMEKSDEM